MVAMVRRRVIILGAAGRDFHNFNMLYASDPAVEVVAFTAQQIPNIAGRRYPGALAGDLHPDGIPIEPEERLESLVQELAVDECIMAYSDVAHVDVMHLASRANAAGADFAMIAPRRTMLRSSLPVVAVCASRTGAGKSQTSRAVVRTLRAAGLRVAVLRHPMPYGDLAQQAVQRFASAADLERHEVTIEEREEYEPHIAAGSVVWAGVDYATILARAEQDADVIVWDGGNNDTSFLHADLYITVVDPHRAGHETTYHPGETNLRLADVVLINKMDTATPEAIERIRRNIAVTNSRARVLEADSPFVAEDPSILRGRSVLAIEDGPTLTHGEMGYGVAVLAAKREGARLIDPRPFAVGSIADALRRYAHIGAALPALGYGEQEIADLQSTVAAAVRHGAEAVAIGTPVDLSRLIDIAVPHTRVRYELRLRDPSVLEELLSPLAGGMMKHEGSPDRSNARTLTLP
jgi:predicted GTPase